MEKITTLDDLKKESINLSKPILVRWPQFNNEEILNPSVGTDMNNQYSVHNSVVAFVCDGVMYVIPYMLSVIQVLKENNFKLNNMEVPFSRGDYPFFEKARWFYLQHVAHKQSFINFKNQCITYCNEKSIMPLPESLLKKCFEMPKDGIHVKTVLDEDYYYPILVKPFFDTFAMHMLGLYAVNKNTCVFVYRDGSTYITRSNEVIKALPKLGYVKTSMFVPLSKNEAIIEPEFADLWNKVCSDN